MFYWNWKEQWQRLQVFSRGLHMAPLAVAAVCVGLGIWAQDKWQIPVAVLWPVVIASGACVIVCADRRRFFAPAYVLCLFSVSALYMGLAVRPVADSIARVSISRKVWVWGEGRVVSEPEFSARKMTFVLGLSRVERDGQTCPASGKVLVEWQKPGEVVYGQRIGFSGYLHPLPGTRQPSQSRYAQYLKRVGIFKILRCSGKDQVWGLPGRPGWFAGLRNRIRAKIKSILQASASSECQDLVCALVLGEKGRVPNGLKRAMIATGTWHVMVVSGSHTAFLAGIILLMLKIMRVPRRVRFVLACGIVALYAALIGPSPSVERASVMTIVLMLSFLIERKPLFYNSLALAALILLLKNPNVMFDLGFQLSFLSVFFIVWLYPGFDIKNLWADSSRISGILFRFLPPGSSGYRVARGMAACGGVSLAAWLGTTPLLSYQFGVVSLVALPANMLIAPLSMVAVGASFTLAVVGVFCPLGGWLIGQALELIFLLMARISFAFASLPIANLGVRLPLLVVCGIYIVLLLRPWLWISVFKE